jgi:cytochrome c oxidase subunit 4
MSSGHAHDVKAEVRRYMLVFAALVIGTIVTVLASYIDIGHGGNIILALIIATAKGPPPARFFIHFFSDSFLIYTILVATVFFFAGLMYLTLWSLQPTSLMHDPAAIKHQTSKSH